MKKYLFYSSILAIFSEAIEINSFIDIKLFYVIVLVNLAIMTIMERATLKKGLILFYLFLIVSGSLSIFMGTNQLPLFAAQFVGILISSFYYYNFVSFFKDRLGDIMSFYTKVCFWLAIVGILITLIKSIVGGEFSPLQSIMKEPAHYGAIVLPAFFYALKMSRKETIVIELSLLLSASSLVVLGMGLCLLLYANKISIVKLVSSIMLVVMLFIITYTSYAPLKIRIDDTYASLATRNLSGANLSTYAFVSNFYVATESLVRHPLLGSGLGSHELSRTKFFGDIEGAQEGVFLMFVNLNAKDANSLFIRIMSDLGLLGLIFTFAFIFKNYVPFREQFLISSVISKAILIYFFCKLLREGHYFSPEMYFFVFIYLLNAKGFRLAKRGIIYIGNG